MKCPICGKPATSQYKPFCSKRCADVDLGRWLKGSYAIADEHAEEHSVDGRENDDERNQTNGNRQFPSGHRAAPRLENRDPNARRSPVPG